MPSRAPLLISMDETDDPNYVPGQPRLRQSPAYSRVALLAFDARLVCFAFGAFVTLAVLASQHFRGICGG